MCVVGLFSNLSQVSAPHRRSGARDLLSRVFFFLTIYTYFFKIIIIITTIIVCTTVCVIFYKMRVPIYVCKRVLHAAVCTQAARRLHSRAPTGSGRGGHGTKRGGKKKKLFSFIPPVAVTNGAPKTICLRRVSGGNFFFKYVLYIFYLTNVYRKRMRVFIFNFCKKTFIVRRS